MHFALPRSAAVSVWPPLPLARARLNQCLFLAVLLHLLLIALFGTAPGGTARPGEGVWGRINVTLRGVAGGGTPSEVAVAPNTVETGPVGKAPQQRSGGAVRAEPTPPSTEAGAAQLGRFNPEPTPSLNEPLPESATQVLQAAPESRLERVQKVTPLSSPATGAEALTALPAQSPVTVPRLAPSDSANRVERLQRSPALSTAPSAAPEAVQALPAQRAVTVPRLEAEPGRSVERLQRAEPLTSPALQGRPAETVQSLPAQAAVEAPAPPLPTLQAPADSAGSPVAPLQAQKLTPLPASPAPGALAPGGVPRAAPAGEAPRGQPQAAGVAPVGAPDAGSRLGHDVATAPSASASAPRAPLDLRLPKGGELARRQGAPSVFQMMPTPPEKKSKLTEDMEKAARGDCRNEHSGAGLLAVVPLVADTVRGKGCKW